MSMRATVVAGNNGNATNLTRYMLPWRNKMFSGGNFEYCDSDSGLGIKGINNDQSLPVIPSKCSIAHISQLENTDIVCRKCHASQNFDGAMFTTSGTNICDDCF